MDRFLNAMFARQSISSFGDMNELLIACGEKFHRINFGWSAPLATAGWPQSCYSGMFLKK